MTVDLKKLKEGDTVKFRCGGECTVEYICKCNNGIRITLEGAAHGWFHWCYNGKFTDKNSTTDPFDIVEIIPKKFDWNDAKPGMAFSNDRELLYYIGNTLTNDDYVVCQYFRKGEHYYCDYKKESLKRSPEHDIEVNE